MKPRRKFAQCLHTAYTRIGCHKDQGYATDSFRSIRVAVGQSRKQLSKATCMARFLSVGTCPGPSFWPFQAPIGQAVSDTFYTLNFYMQKKLQVFQTKSCTFLLVTRSKKIHAFPVSERGNWHCSCQTSTTSLSGCCQLVVLISLMIFFLYDHSHDSVRSKSQWDHGHTLTNQSSTVVKHVMLRFSSIPQASVRWPIDRKIRRQSSSATLAPACMMDASRGATWNSVTNNA